MEDTCSLPCFIWKLRNTRLVLTKLKSHCGPGVRKVKELPLRSDLYDDVDTRQEVKITGEILIYKACLSWPTNAIFLGKSD